MTDTIHPAPGSVSPEQLAADPILQFFHYAHLPAALQASSRPFCEMAVYLVETLPRNAERSTALRKLLEAKDAAVRATVSVSGANGDRANVGAVASKGSFLDRLKTERDQLRDRWAKLNKFLDSDEAPDQGDMLYQQRTVMTDYLAILDARIENIEHGATVGEVREIGGADQDRDGPIDFGS